MPAPKRRLTVFAVAMAVLIATPLVVGASDTFTDVPDSNVHHNDITWLADAGVTLGCNPPDNTNFCPESPVLRQQMASFLRRLAENQVVDAATAVTAGDADALGGAAPTAYRTVVSGANCDQTGANTCPTSGTLASVDLTAPAAGIVKIDYSMSIIELNSGEGLVQAWANSDDECNWFLIPLDSLLGSFSITAFPDLGGTQYHSISGTTTVSVPAGTTTFSVCAAPIDGEVQYASISTVWSPEGTGVALASSGDFMAFPDSVGAEFEGVEVPGFDN